MNKVSQKGSARMARAKGFTIIELIVVIAIIAVLAGIVLVNVTSYLNKGRDAAIKGNLSSLMTDAATIFDRDGSYNATNGVCSSNHWNPLNNTLNSAGGIGICAGNATKWCASSRLTVNSSNTFCVDYTGRKIEGSSGNYNCNSGTYVCP
jgi:prepilin-type N-terminal cleavage/methylation domain-containing protein